MPVAIRGGMLTTNHPGNDSLLRDLEHAVLRLADAVDGEPPISAALRRFARTLPPAAPSPPRPVTREHDVRGVLYEALDAGALDVRGFDWLMLAEGRARRAQARPARARRARRLGPPIAGQAP